MGAASKGSEDRAGTTSRRLVLKGALTAAWVVPVVTTIGLSQGSAAAASTPARPPTNPPRTLPYTGSSTDSNALVGLAAVGLGAGLVTAAAKRRAQPETVAATETVEATENG